MSAVHLYTVKCLYKVESKSVAVWGTEFKKLQGTMNQKTQALSV